MFSLSLKAWSKVTVISTEDSPVGLYSQFTSATCTSCSVQDWIPNIWPRKNHILAGLSGFIYRIPSVVHYTGLWEQELLPVESPQSGPDSPHCCCSGCIRRTRASMSSMWSVQTNTFPDMFVYFLLWPTLQNGWRPWDLPGTWFLGSISSTRRPERFQLCSVWRVAVAPYVHAVTLHTQVCVSKTHVMGDTLFVSIVANC